MALHVEADAALSAQPLVECVRTVALFEWGRESAKMRISNLKHTMFAEGWRCTMVFLWSLSYRTVPPLRFFNRK